MIDNLFRLTKSEYFADFFITPPITVILTYMSLARDVSVSWFALLGAGFFAWTFYEYAMHRWVSHRLWLFKKYHFLHHAQQRDYIAIHPLVTLTLYAAFWLLFGFQSSAFMVGFSIGYIAYSIAHTLFHYARIERENFLFAAKVRHALHHKYDDVNFGVTTNIWDKVFGTDF